MATIYEFTLNNGQQTFAGENAIILMADGTTRPPSAVQIGDMIIPIFDAIATVTNVITQEV